MKCIIAGGRDFEPQSKHWKFLDTINYYNPITEVVSGACRGADQFGEKWAESLSIPIKKFPADWDKYGKRAGAIRNQQMAEYADMLITFPGGKGTELMRGLAKKQKLTIIPYLEFY